MLRAAHGPVKYGFFYTMHDRGSEKASHGIVFSSSDLEGHADAVVDHFAHAFHLSEVKLQKWDK